MTGDLLQELDGAERAVIHAVFDHHVARSRVGLEPRLDREQVLAAPGAARRGDARRQRRLGAHALDDLRPTATYWRWWEQGERDVDVEAGVVVEVPDVCGRRGGRHTRVDL